MNKNPYIRSTPEIDAAREVFETRMTNCTPEWIEKELDEAVIRLDAAAVRYALEHGGDVNLEVSYGINRVAPILFQAVSFLCNLPEDQERNERAKEVINVLLEFGADPSKKSYKKDLDSEWGNAAEGLEGLNSIELAYIRCQDDVVQTLTDAAQKISERDSGLWGKKVAEERQTPATKGQAR